MPDLKDLFCGAGGCSVGYTRAGYTASGIDIEPHPDYPYDMQVGDALTWLDDLVAGRVPDPAVVHASPPCPRYSIAGSIGSYDPSTKPDLLGPVRDRLTAWGGTWVIENVPGAPMPDAVTLCGWAMGLRHIRRHRLFESNVFLMSPGCACPDGDTVSVFGHSGEDRRKTTIIANGRKRTHLPLAEVRTLMGVEWMRSRDDIADAIPPAYTQHIGEQILLHAETV